MADNLKTLKERIIADIDPAGAPGSILAQNHQEILIDVLNKVGKHTGFLYTANKVVAVFPNGTMSWESNAMNNLANFDIKVSKLTADLNNFGHILDLLSAGDLIKFKDFAGRTVLLEYVSHVADVDGSANDIFVITVKGKAENINYTYQDTEVLSCVFEIVSFSSSLSVDNIVIQPELTSNTTISGTKKGIFNLFPINSESNIEITVDKGTYQPGDVVNFKRRGLGGVSFLRGDNVRLEGYRSLDNIHRIANKGNLACIIFDYLDGDILVGSVIGDIERGNTGVPTVDSYTNLTEGDVNEDVTVFGSGFSENMIVDVSANATQVAPFTYVDEQEIILHLTAVGLEGDTVTVTFDNGDVLVDVDAITISEFLVISYQDYKTWYKLDETTGTSVEDESLNAINGTTSGTPNIGVSGKVGNAISFDGVDDFITIPSPLGITAFPFTVQFWVNLPSLTFYKRILTSDSPNAYSGVNIRIDSGVIDVLLGKGLSDNTTPANRRTFTTGTVLSSATWHQLTIVVTDIDTCDIYVDGVLVSIASDSGTADVCDFTLPHTVAKDTKDGEYDEFLMDELKSWDRALTPQEITDIYTLENAGNPML